MDTRSPLNPDPTAVAAARAAAEALPEGIEPKTPVPIYVHQSTTLCAVVDRDRQPLADAGCDPAAVATLAARLVALRDTDVLWQVRRTGKGEPQREREARAIALRDATQADLRWWLRGDAEVQARLDDVAEGEGLADALHDLEQHAQILDDHGAAIPRSAGFDPAERAAACREAAASARDGVAAWKASVTNDELKARRDKAFAWADAAVREVRAAGRYVFRNDPERLADYRNGYHAAQQRKYRRTRTAQAQEPVPA